jgi:uncharacterized protein (DUF1800 family)
MREGLRERRLLARAGFGARPEETHALRGEEVEAWVARQSSPPARDPQLEHRLAGFRSGADGSWDALMGMDIPDPESSGARDAEVRQQLSQRAREITHEVVGARLVRAVHARFALREVMIDFWSNHFSVFGRKALVGALLPHYESRVLEPFALGRFEDLLLAVAQSPAMLVYLDNWSSTAPQLPGWLRRGRLGRGGLNENYARELLELHTLGVDGGYTQADVVEVARVFTGWTLDSRRNPVFRFRERLHDPGAKRVLGEPVRGAGIEEGRVLLRRLARHPATARHICRKLAARFVADDPPPELVARAARRFLDTEGDLREVVSAILLSPELAAPEHRKLKTPLRLAVSALRETGGETDGAPVLLLAIGRLGELPYFSRTPAGFPEAAAHWVDPGALLERMGLAFALARGEVPGTRLGPRAPGGAGPLAAGRASAAEAQALALASPEFQWS